MQNCSCHHAKAHVCRLGLFPQHVTRTPSEYVQWMDDTQGADDVRITVPGRVRHRPSFPGVLRCETP